MNRTTINLDAIAFVELIPETEDKTITYQEVILFNWKKFKVVGEQRYVDENRLSGRYMTEEKLIKTYPNQLLKHNKLYFKSKVHITTISGKRLTKQFNTESEAETYYQSLNRKLTNKTEL